MENEDFESKECLSAEEKQKLMNNSKGGTEYYRQQSLQQVETLKRVVAFFGVLVVALLVVGAIVSGVFDTAATEEQEL